MNAHFLHRFAVLFLLMFSLTSVATANDDWVTLGSKRASISANKMTFDTQDSQTLGNVRFHVTKGDIKLIKAKLHMDNGQVIMEGLQKEIHSNDYSRSIPLTSHDQQRLKKVELFYKVIHQDSPSIEAQVTLMGMPASR